MPLSPKKSARKYQQPWDNRFNVTFSKDNEKMHSFYKEYFDKTHKQHLDRSYFNYRDNEELKYLTQWDKFT